MRVVHVGVVLAGAIACVAQPAFAGRVPVSGLAAATWLSRPVRELGVSGAPLQTLAPRLRQVPRGRLRGANAQSSGAPDGALQTFAAVGVMPPPTLTFEGVSNADNSNVFGFSVIPPDPNGDVGPNHYVQYVNLLFQVFDKSGNALTSPFPMSLLFASAGTQSVCALSDGGDPVVLYDPLADRWVLTQIGALFDNLGNPLPPFHQCFAVSASPDPTGAYFLYDFALPKGNSRFNDAPKLGVWPDAYYLATNQFDTSLTSFLGAGVYAFDRAKMLVGSGSASLIYFDLFPSDPTIFGLLPSDFDGLIPPPLGRPNTFAYFTADEFGDPQDGLRLFDFHVDFANPLKSSFMERPESPITVQPFDPFHPSPDRADIPQPAPGVALDAITDVLMHRLQYRNLGSFETLVTNHAVSVTMSPYTAGVRYYELQRPLPLGVFTVPEQATFAPDSDSRWNGSAALDHQGNLAVGYSVSGPATDPSIRYAGRFAGDVPNGLTQSEATLIAGTGVQTSDTSRWGDYSMLGVDPVNDCDFWYTNEYYTAAGQALSSHAWQTRIGSFTFAGCTAAPSGSLTVTVTLCTTGAPLANAVVQAPGGYLRTTDTSGVATFGALTPGVYTMTVTKPGFTAATFTTTIVDAQASVVSACLNIAPPVPVESYRGLMVQAALLFGVGAVSLLGLRWLRRRR